MYLVAIAWMYVVLMMALAEATSKQGTVLGAVFTFLLYGAAPLALVLYLMGTPGRRRRQRAAERAAEATAPSAAPEAAGETNQGDEAAGMAPASSAHDPDRRGEPAGDGLAPVGKEP
ncbi:MAG: hypothetical protein RJA98_3860 [Pseudomonadota bacterium]|jgi:hypothetical protein